MNDPTGEPREIGGAEAPAMPVCPFVGRQNDPALVEGAPDAEHRCYKPPSPHRIRSDIQGRFCLSARYQRCPVYRGVVAHPPGPSLSERLFGGGLLGVITSPPGLAFIFFAMLIPAAIGVGFAVLDDDDDPAAEQAAAVADTDAASGAEAAQQAQPGEAAQAEAQTQTQTGTAAGAADAQPAAGQQTADAQAADDQAAGDQATGQEAAGEPAAGEQAGDQATEPAAPPAEAPDPALTPRERLFNWTDLAEHVVEAGDSLGAVAAVYGTTVEALAVFNGIADVNSIAVGQVLGVPVGFTEALDFEPAVAPAATDTDVAPPVEDADAGDGADDDDATDADGDAGGEDASDGGPAATEALLGWTDVVEWTVASGDTLFLIAQELATTVDAIAALNEIDPADPILVGQLLRVPRGFLDPIE
jgi:LysM repeat protein